MTRVEDILGSEKLNQTLLQRLHPKGFKIKDVHRVRENASDVDTFDARFEGEEHRFEGDMTPSENDEYGGSYGKKRTL